MKGIRRLITFVTASVALLAVPNTAAAATIANGGFETGTLSGWQTQISGGGGWFAYSGTTSPVFAQPIAAPPQGSFAVVTDPGAPGTSILYQDVALEPGTHTLSLDVYYRSTAAIAHPSPDSLSSSDFPNQQYRIDVMKPSAPLTSINPADILLPIFRTATGDPTTLAPTMKTADLTPFAGQTVRLRFAEVDNAGPFFASTDAVSIASTPSNSFTLGAVQRNKKKGTATLNLTLPNPGDVTGSGNGVQASSAAQAEISKSVGAGQAQLLIKAKGKKKKKLNETGKVKLNVTVTYTPTGGSPSTQSLTVKLKKKI